MTGWTLFTDPMVLKFDSLLWLLIPLCAAVAILYKAVRVHHARQMPLEIAVLLGYMIAGLALLGAGLWLIQTYWP